MNSDYDNKENTDTPVTNTDEVFDKQTVYLTIFLSVISSFIHAALCTNGDGLKLLLYWSIFLMGNFIGNLMLFAAASGISKSIILKIIAWLVAVTIGCFIFYTPPKTTYYTKPSKQFNSYSEIYGDKPYDGMTKEQIEKQDWGAYRTYTKCLDFDRLRVERRSYNVVWYDSDGNKIGSGSILFDKQGNTKLNSFRDYSTT